MLKLKCAHTGECAINNLKAENSNVFEVGDLALFLEGDNEIKRKELKSTSPTNIVQSYSNQNQNRTQNQINVSKTNIHTNSTTNYNPNNNKYEEEYDDSIPIKDEFAVKEE